MHPFVVKSVVVPPTDESRGTYLLARGPTLQKIVYEISKSFDFIEITLISSDFTDFKMISLVSSSNNYLDITFPVVFKLDLKLYVLRMVS